MILAELLIENYKQYAGEHRIEFPPRGIVGVIGANGVGKTTLFEAIEWCLYNPREIGNVAVPPRAGVGHTRVQLILEDPRDGARYVVERTLRRGNANGEVYREDHPESPIVQGSRPVTEYVTNHLIGLGQRAFVSTFFTRQKELSFFGNLRETDRRREVARLLGFETIREAQRLIGEERNRARAEAQSLRLQYDEQSTGHDFTIELAGIEQAIAARESAAAAAREQLATATETHRRARAERDRWSDLERQDATIGREIERVGGDQRAATERRDAALAALRRLDEDVRQREQLAPIAVTEPARVKALATHEAERERAQRLRELQNDTARAARDRDEATHEMRRHAASIPEADAAVANWAWQPEDQTNPLAAATRRLQVVAALDVDGAARVSAHLAHCAKTVIDRDRERANLKRCIDTYADLQDTRENLLRDGHPKEQAEVATRAWEQATKAAQSADAQTKTTVAERKRLMPIASALRDQRFDDECPTCGRAFSEHEAGVVLSTLERRIADLTTEEHRLGGQIQDANTRARAADAERKEAIVRAESLAHIEARLAVGDTKVGEARQNTEQATRQCEQALTEAGLDQEPTPDQVERANTRAALLKTLAATAPLLGRLRQNVQQAEINADASRREIAALGTVAYDTAAHQAARAAVDAARAAASRIEQIDLGLAHRSDHETTRNVASAGLDQLAGTRSRLEADRARIGFDLAALQRAIADETAAFEATGAATNALNAAETALRDAVRTRDDLVKEQTRLAALAERADARGREADELDRMYDEFSGFDKYVARQITPQLAEQTGEILGAITEHTYDRVDFDENYGLTIYDDDEAFPVTAFSGGERDVAALAARLALSRLVGAQAAHPPNFLVLDEVFGSLDADRRARVLATLADLTTNTAAFRQLFIISHVEDVQLTPIFDEIWRITDVDGVSQFENATRAPNLADL